jgi:rhodanese-related sulfurtransferase
MMKQISPLELRSRLDSADAKPVLLDVREPVEYRHCRIEGSLHIPMNDVPARIGELDPQRETVVICHHGMRSASVANYLIRQGFQNVFNLSGGVDAWAIQVAPDMPRY